MVKMRMLFGLAGDGCDLVHDCSGQKHGVPMLALNPPATETQRASRTVS